jgi:hypothetical protein
MAEKGKMPPQLLAHFKSKNEGKESGKPDKDTDDSNKAKRKEAVTKARVRLEEKNKKPYRGKEKETR